MNRHNITLALIGGIILMLALFAVRDCRAHPLDEALEEFVVSVVDTMGQGGPTEPPPVDPPPGSGACDDPLVDPRHSQCVEGGFWDGFATGDVRKLRDDGSNRERNATIKSLGAIMGRPRDAMLRTGSITFEVMVNAEALEQGGGGKHLVNVASTPLSRGSREYRKQTRLEIARPGNPEGAAIILHNYDIMGSGGAHQLGRLNFQWPPNIWVELTISWELVNQTLRVVVNNQIFTHTLLPESEGIGRYWGPGHFETNSRGGVMWYSLPESP